MTFAPGTYAHPAPSEPVLATVVVVFREGPRGREVLLVRRGAERRFASGFHAFPGGKVDPEDAAVPVAGASGERATLVACATRELFEETGILLARGAERVSRDARLEGRRALLAGERVWGDFLMAVGASLDAELLSPAGRWITPEFLPLRYDARMFLSPLPRGQEAEIWPGELAGGGFVAASQALALFERGEVLLHPPNLHAVRVIAREGPPDVELLRSPPPAAHRIEFQGGFLLVPLRTPTLPPATHTNCWLVPADGGVAVVDPGPTDPGEQAHLLGMLDELAAEGRPPRSVWLTHAHPDHTGAVALVARRYGIPVLAHASCARRVPGVSVRAVREGDLIAGRFLALETPGHAREHLAFLDETTGALLCGDLVSTLSTIVIDPPEGEMAEYERQLERVKALAPRTLYPAHGPPAPNGPSRLAAYLAHRHEREGLVVRAIADGGGSLGEVTARSYPDIPPPMLPLAERSCLAVLLKLAAEGRARERHARWSRA